MSLLKHVFFFLISSLCASQLVAQASQPEQLKRPAALRNLKGASADAIASILAQAHVPGGIVSVYPSCAKPKEFLFASKSETVQDGLDYVSRLDESQAWIYRNGVVLTGFRQAPKTLLNTAISKVTIEPTETLSLATQHILESIELKDVIGRTGMEQLTTPLGFSEIQNNSDSTSPSPENRKREVLFGKTLEDALNALALSRNSAVWHYEQYNCGKKSSFRVSWLVKGGP